MNQISALWQASKHYSNISHWHLAIDGIPIDKLFDHELQSEGLVLTIQGWMYHDHENSLAWQRIMPDLFCTTYAPILICPDEIDFHCATVIAEIWADNSEVIWKRIGYDLHSNDIGMSVAWTQSLGPYIFKREQYEECLRQIAKKQGHD